MPRHRSDDTTEFARHLRRNMTPEELRLRWYLAARTTAKWRRQEPVGRYFADFLSYEHRVIVEVDGSQHIDSAYDQRRDAYLESRGFRVLRVYNDEVNNNIDVVLEVINDALSSSSRKPQ